MKIISITGTKGKTTITRGISYVLNKSGENTLRVDTDGHYINEKQKSNLEDSKEIASMVPTVCPGRYLIEMRKYLSDFIAIFETALGCSSSAGLGYGSHQIGIFTNVLEDHLGVTKRLKTRMDIAKAKKFIFSSVGNEGWSIFNGDDRLVCSQLKEAPDNIDVNYLPVGLEFNEFDIKKHLKNGGSIVTRENNFVVIKSKNKTRKVLSFGDVEWTFDGFSLPSVYNLMFIVGALFAYGNGKINRKLIKHLKDYKLDKYGGRLTRLEGEQGIDIIVDYAHEKYSLKEVAKLAKNIKRKKGRVVGVLRLAPDRTDKMITETGTFIAPYFDKFIIYDKIDGVVKSKYEGKRQKIVRGIGEVSQIFTEGILAKKNKNDVFRIILEEDAIKKAAEISKKGDIVVVICNDNHKRSIEYVKKYFKAKFL